VNAPDKPDFIGNLAGAIRVRAAADGSDPPAVRRDLLVTDDFGDDDPGEVSLEAISAATASAFAGNEVINEVTDERVIVATGALIMALVVANDQHGDGFVLSPSEVRLVAPWEATHPGLLDPVMWMLATAVDYVG
jgi:hypothetical protein